MEPNEVNQQADSDKASNSPSRKKKRLVLLLILVLAVIASLLYLISFSNFFSGLTGVNDSVAQVKITESGFTPSTIKIKKGQTVEWVNDDSAPHKVASDPYPDHSLLPHLVSDEPLAQGDTFSFTFDAAGAFTYHDDLKPEQFKGTVIVE